MGGASRPIDILNPLSSEANIKQEDHSSASFNSPPQAEGIFGNRKCLSSTDFSDLYSSASKQKRTPSRGSVAGSPSTAKSPTDILHAQAEARSQSVISAETFLKKENMTDKNKSILFEVVSKRNRDIIAFDDGPQLFYRIMTFYSTDLNFIPDDVKHKELQKRLFTFIMKNVEYTQVIVFEIAATVF